MDGASEVSAPEHLTPAHDVAAFDFVRPATWGGWTTLPSRRHDA